MRAPTGLIGVVHLPPLPGDPGHPAAAVGQTGVAAALDFAWADAQALIAGGIDAIIVENFGSAPFAKGTRADPAPVYQVAALTRLCAKIRDAWPGQLGVNCLRNDARAALGIAAACELDFIRVNVHTGAFVTDQGLIEGEATETLRLRDALGLSKSTAILADVLVKHAAPLAPIDARTATADLVKRGRADAVIVSGEATGAPVSAALLDEVRAACSDLAPVLIGSGLQLANADALSPRCHGAIVGTSLKVDGRVDQAVDPDRVRALGKACHFLAAPATPSN